MDLKFDNETIVRLLYKARRKIASREAIYNCRCQIDRYLNYEKWKKQHIKKEREGNGKNISLKYCPNCGKRMDGDEE